MCRGDVSQEDKLHGQNDKLKETKLRSKRMQKIILIGPNKILTHITGLRVLNIEHFLTPWGRKYMFEGTLHQSISPYFSPKRRRGYPTRCVQGERRFSLSVHQFLRVRATEGRRHSMHTLFAIYTSSKTQQPTGCKDQHIKTKFEAAPIKTTLYSEFFFVISLLVFLTCPRSSP